MKKGKRLLTVVTSGFLALCMTIATAGFINVTAFAKPTFGNVGLEKVPDPVDPQSWQLQRDMTWDDYKPNPVIDWTKDLNKNSLNNKFAWDGNPNKPIIGGLLLFEYLDRKFISRQPVGSDPLGYYAMNEKYANPDKDGLTSNPAIDVYELFAAEEGITREALIAKYTTGDHAPDKNGLTTLDKRFAQWWADFLNKPSEVNNYTGISEYWRENSYGKWDVDLRPFGPYTIPYFEFETMGGYDMSSGYQTYRDIPPSFRRGAAGTQNANTDFAFDTIAHGIAREKGHFDGLDFFFLLHAGYDESGVWQEFGQAQFPTRKDIPYELGPGPRMTQVEEFFTENPDYLEIYAERYANHYGKQFWADALAEYKGWETAHASWAAIPNNPAPEPVYKFKLSQEDWDWVNGYNDITTKNTRYVSFAPWLAAISEWTHAVSTVQVEYKDPVSGETKTREIRRSTQGENDAMATFAHEFCHISQVADNYGNAWTGGANPYTEPWDIVSRGSFGGPYGDHARWMVPGVEAGTVPSHLMQYLKNIHFGYNDEDDVLEVKVEDLAKSTPVVANIVSRNIPLANEFYPGLADYGLTKGNYYKNLKLDFAYDLQGEWADQNKIGNTGFTNTAANKKATNIYVEVVDQSGYDSFLHDYGVMLSRAYDNPRRTYTGGTAPSHSIIDSHLYDIAMIDYTLGDKPEDYAPYPLAHATQLADVTFKAGVSSVDTGYYATKYKLDQNGKPIVKPRPSDAQQSASVWPLNPANWEVDVPGSIVRWEERNGRDIVSGNTVNEYYDEANKLHIYILQKNMNDGRKIGDETLQFLSYQVGVLHDNGEPVNGELIVEKGELQPATAGRVAVQEFKITNKGADATDIIRVEIGGTLGYKTTILNNLFAIAPDETITVPVYIEVPEAVGFAAASVPTVTLTSLSDADLTLTASSESNAAKTSTATVGNAANQSTVNRLIVTTDKAIVSTNEYFNVNVKFAEKVSSNTAILTYTFDTDKFEFRNVTLAPGVRELNRDYSTPGILKLTVMVDDYDTLDYGDVLFSAKADIDLTNKANEILVKVQCVVKDANGEKTVKGADGGTVQLTGLQGDTNGDGKVDLIDLSNMIDWYGFNTKTPGWETDYVFYDFNRTGEIDISDVTKVAQLINL